MTIERGDSMPMLTKPKKVRGLASAGGHGIGVMKWKIHVCQKGLRQWVWIFLGSSFFFRIRKKKNNIHHYYASKYLVFVA